MNLEELKNQLFRKYIFWKTRPARIDKYLKKKTAPKSLEESEPVIEKGQIKVAAVQLEMTLYQDIRDFIDKMESIVIRAAQVGNHLLVFPEDNLTQLIGLLPGIADSNQQGSAVEDLLSGLGEGVRIIDVLSYIGPVIARASLHIFSRLASKYRIYIMAGSGMLPAADEYIYNTAFLFDPEGNLLGEQKKLHLLPLEYEWGLSTGNRLKVFDTAIGKLALPVCMDATYFETFRIAANKGAEIVMIPIANPDIEYNYWTALRGIWGRVQESKVYGIKSAMVGNFLGFSFTGQSGIYAPLELTPGKNGILAEAENSEREEIVMAELDLGLLQEYRKKMVKNHKLWEYNFPGIYKK